MSVIAAATVLIVSAVALIPTTASAQAQLTCMGVPVTIMGTLGDDDLMGTAGDDVIVGFAGNDRIDGGPGNDIICGGADNDVVLGGPGDDMITGSKGDDVVLGGPGSDKLRGGSGDDILDGGAGDDDVRGASGNDELSGSDGNDDLRGNAGDDELNGEDGDDVANGGPGDDIVTGGIGDDLLFGRVGNDRLYGHEGADELRGGRQDDVLVGGPGIDELRGGAETDACDDIAGEFRNTCESDAVPATRTLNITFVDGFSGGPGDLAGATLTFTEQSVSTGIIALVSLESPDNPFPITAIATSCADAQLDPELAGFPCVEQEQVNIDDGASVAAVTYDGSAIISVEVPTTRVQMSGQMVFPDDPFCWFTAFETFEPGVDAATVEVAAACA